MTDLVITAASVVPGTNAKVENGTFGATITAGQVVYKEAATRTYKLADNNSATVEARTPYGIALNGGAAGQPGDIILKGDVTSGATMTAGVAYYLSGTPGGVCPVADLTTGMYPTVLGIAKSTTVLTVNITPSGVAL